MFESKLEKSLHSLKVTDPAPEGSLWIFSVRDPYSDRPFSPPFFSPSLSLAKQAVVQMVLHHSKNADEALNSPLRSYHLVVIGSFNLFHGVLKPLKRYQIVSYIQDLISQYEAFFIDYFGCKAEQGQKQSGSSSDSVSFCAPDALASSEAAK